MLNGTRMQFLKLFTRLVPIVAAASIIPLSGSNAAIEYDLIATVGDPVPDSPADTVFYEFFPQVIAQDGTIIFIANVRTGNVDNQRIYRASPTGEIRVVVRGGDELLPGVTWHDRNFETALINASGQVLVGGRINGVGVDASNDEVIVQITNGIAAVVARKGDPAPGAGGETFTSLFPIPFVPDFLSLTEDGKALFRASLSDGTSGLWIGAPGNLNSVAIEGRPVFGTPNIVWEQLRSITTGSNGKLLIVGGTRIADGASLTRGIYLINPDGTNPTIEVIEGRDLPDDPPNRISGFFIARANDSSQLAFSCRVTDEEDNILPDRRVYAGTSQALTNLTPSGFAAPYVGPNYTVSDAYAGGITQTGAVAFQVMLETGPVSNPAYFLRRASGELLPVAYVGQNILLDATPLEIAFVNYSYGSMNDASEIPLLIADSQPLARLVVARDVVDDVIIADATAPTIRIRGPRKVVTPRRRYRVRGVAADETALDRVEIRIRRQGFRRVRGVDRWQQRVRLRPGRNRVLVRAIDASGNVSSRAKQIVVRRNVAR